MKKVLSILLSIVLIISVSPLGVFDFTASAETTSGTCGDNLTWEYDNSTYIFTISGTGEMYDYSYSLYYGDYVTTAPWRQYYKTIKTVVINSGVTSIGWGAFFGCTSLTSITIPDSVTEIGGGAFSDCSSLTSIIIPDSVTEIGGGAFYGCTGLTSITIPDSVTEIGGSAFDGCTGLTSITVAEGNTVYHSAGNCLIETAKKELIAGCKNSVIPTDGSVTSIGDCAFYGCEGLTSIIIPDSVTEIGDSAFDGCTELKCVTIGNSVTSIGSCAFDGCEGLTSITIPNSVTSIGDYAFHGCTGLTNITIPDNVISVGLSAFSNCTSLISLTIPNSVTIIGDYAFGYCTGLESIVVKEGNLVYHSAGNCLIETASKTLILGCNNSSIPNDGSVVSIGSYAFRGCKTIKSITIPDSVTSIGYCAFDVCDMLETVTIGNSVTTIGDRAFRGCVGLKSITIPSSVKSIYGEAFSYCESLTSITIPSGVKSIYGEAFSYCESLTSITIPDSVTSIGCDAFYNTAWYNNQPDGLVYAGKVAYEYKGTCPANVTIKDGTVGIADGAFSSCEGLTSIIIPNSVTSIGDDAFSCCEGLTSITIPDSVTSIGCDAFYNTAWYNNQPDGLIYVGKVAYEYKGTCPANVTIKDGTVNIAGSAFYDCTGLTSVIIPDSVTSIGSYAFDGCTGLTSITIPDSVTSIGDYAFSWCEGLTSVTIPKSVVSIENGAFYECESITDVYYDGTEEDRADISISDYNDCLLSARWHYLEVPSDVMSENVGFMADSIKKITFSEHNKHEINFDSAKDITDTKMIELDVYMNGAGFDTGIAICDSLGNSALYNFIGLKAGWNHLAVRVSDLVQHGSNTANVNLSNISKCVLSGNAGEEVTIANLYAADYVEGDANRDGVFDIRDVVRAKKMAAGVTAEGNKLAVSGDDYEINAVDLTNMIHSIIDSLFV